MGAHCRADWFCAGGGAVASRIAGRHQGEDCQRINTEIMADVDFVTVCSAKFVRKVTA
jgi:hypothetical protein